MILSKQFYLYLPNHINVREGSILFNFNKYSSNAESIPINILLVDIIINTFCHNWPFEDILELAIVQNENEVWKWGWHPCPKASVSNWIVLNMIFVTMLWNGNLSSYYSLVVVLGFKPCSPTSSSFTWLYYLLIKHNKESELHPV